METKIWKGVITHPKPHRDEDVALWELRKYGDAVYPGIREAIKNKSVLFLREDSFTMSAKEYEEDGWLLVGVGGRELDEHATADNEGRKEGECVATLMAKKLGIDTLPELKKILQYTLAGDLNTFTQANSEEMQMLKETHSELFKKLISDLSTLRGVDPDSTVKLLHEQNPDNPWVAIEWDFQALDAKFAEQYEFNVLAPEEAKKAYWEKLGKCHLAVIETDCPEVETYLRTRKGGFASVVIKRSPTKKQVQIFTNSQSKPRIELADAATILRLLEVKARKRPDKPESGELSREGNIGCAPEWNYFKKAEILLNGSRTAPNTPPTKIPLKVLISAVRFVLLRKRAFEDMKGFVEQFIAR